MANYDAVWKEALETFFKHFLQLLFPAAHADINWRHRPTFLDTELQGLQLDDEKGWRIVDKLVEVRLKSGEDAVVFVHVEVQGQRQAEFTRRMFVYHYRIFDQKVEPTVNHKIDQESKQVVSLAVLADSSPAWRPDLYEYERWGCRMAFSFPTAKLLDFEDNLEQLETSENPFSVVVLANLGALRAKDDPQKRSDLKLAIIRRLYDRKWSKARIRKLLRFIDGLMKLPPALEKVVNKGLEQIEKEKNMPLVTSWERIAKKEGREEGRLDMARESVLKALEVRFGNVPQSLRKAVNQTPTLKKCRSLLQAAIRAESIEAFKKQFQDLK